MAFVTGYDHDVFVSYARLDNPGETPWVSTLVRHLDTDLRQRLGTKDLRVWIDENLDGNRPLTPEIMRSIQRSATLLIVMSSGYLASEWCARERNAFLGLSGIAWPKGGFLSCIAARRNGRRSRLNSAI
ncbi:MAG: toll/interleukin-1 receptor domain-containing protein [Methylococcales bacterium]